MTRALKVLTVAGLALAVATGIFAGTAMAADLGGDCCADLEERIAELEATTARKGNRKVSLTISGYINEAVMWFDTKDHTDIYQGTNETARSRVRIAGEAKVAGDWKAGYLMEFGVRTSRLNRTNQDIGNTHTNAFEVRHSAWWLDNKELGRVWLGQTHQATDAITEITTANTGHFARLALSKFNGGFFLVTPDGVRTTNIWRDLESADGSSGDNVPAEGDRRNLVKYDSPSFAGFKMSAAWGENDFWDTSLRYNTEMAGFKLVAGIGYAEYTDDHDGQNLRGCAAIDPASGPSRATRTSCNTLGLSGSIMHQATGLFVTGAWGRKSDDVRTERYATAGVTGIAIDNKDEFWSVQSGIEQKFISLGKTTVYGEYWLGSTGAQIGDTNGDPRSFQSVSDAVGLGFGAARSSGSMASYWGAGINQSFDAAALELYLGYRHLDGSADLFDANATANQATVDFQGVDIVMSGAKISF